MTHSASNRFKKTKMGRPSKYKPEFINQLIKFFDLEPFKERILLKTMKDGSIEEKRIEIPAVMPFLEDFARKIKVNKDTLHEWAKKHPEFSDALKMVSGFQQKILITNGLRNNYNSGVTCFTAKNILKWRDQSEVEHTLINKDQAKKAIEEIFG